MSTWERLKSAAYSLDCIHGAKATGDARRPWQMLRAFVLTLQASPPGTRCELYPAWDVEIDERRSQGDASPEAIFWYALCEFNASSALRETYNAFIIAALRLANESTERWNVPIKALHDFSATLRTTARRARVAFDLPARSIELGYLGPHTRVDVESRLAEVCKAHGFSWSLDYEHAHSAI